MEYFVLLTTLFSLIFGLLFFVDSLPGQSYPYWLKLSLTILTMIVIVGGNVFVILMILYDIFVRRKKSKKKDKKKKEAEEKLKNFNKKQDQTLEFIHGTKILEQTELPWDVEYEYKFEIISESDDDDIDDHIHSLNDIFDDLLSTDRFKKKVDIAKRKGAKVGVKIVTKTSKVRNRLSKRFSRESIFEESLKNIKDFDNNNNSMKKRNSMVINLDAALDVLQRASEKKDEKADMKKRIDDKRKERMKAIKKKAGSKVVEMSKRKKSLDGLDSYGNSPLSPDLEENIFDNRRKSTDSDVAFIDKNNNLTKESYSPQSPDSTNLSSTYDESFYENKQLRGKRNNRSLSNDYDFNY